MVNDINYPASIQKCKLNIDAAAYENKIDSDVYKPSAKQNLIFMMETRTSQTK